MCPELFSIGPIPIRSFGIGLALSFLLGVFYVRKITQRDGKQFEPMLNYAYIMIFGGVLGARLSYVFLHWSDFSNNLLNAVNPFQSGQFGIAGLNLYGGILLAIGGSMAYAAYRKDNILDIFDYYAPTVGLGIGVSRIGCFLNGCCFGTPTDLPWGVEFPEGSIPYAIFGSAHIHPAQIYSSLYGVALLLILHFVLKKRQFVGQVIALLFMAEALARFLIEYVRYYEDAMWFDLAGIRPTYNQVVSLGLFLAGFAIYVIRWRMNRAKPASPA